MRQSRKHLWQTEAKPSNKPIFTYMEGKAAMETNTQTETASIDTAAEEVVMTKKMIFPKINMWKSLRTVGMTACVAFTLITLYNSFSFKDISSSIVTTTGSAVSYVTDLTITRQSTIDHQIQTVAHSYDNKIDDLTEKVNKLSNAVKITRNDEGTNFVVTMNADNQPGMIKRNWNALVSLF